MGTLKKLNLALIQLAMMIQAKNSDVIWLNNIWLAFFKPLFVLNRALFCLNFARGGEG